MKQIKLPRNCKWLVRRLAAGIAGLPFLLTSPNAAQAQSAPQPAGGSTRAPSTSINVLILALDEADMNAARPANLTEPPPLRSRPPAAGVVPRPPAAPPRAVAPLDQPDGAVPAPAPPAPEEVPAGGMQLPPPPGLPQEDPVVRELPAIMPAALGLPGTIARRASAQVAVTAAGGQASSAIPGLPLMASPGDEPNLEMPNRRPPGRAQIFAAPLRRALVARGVTDVLTTPLDGATVVRTLNNGRISLRTVDQLRYATQQMLDNVGLAPEELPGPAAELQQKAVQTAIAAASRVGLTLGYRAVVVLAVSPGGRHSILLVDAVRETGEVLNPADAVDAVAVDAALTRDQAAASGVAAEIASRLGSWVPFTAPDRVAKLERHMAAARAAVEQQDAEAARDQLQQAVALDASYADAYILLGDVLQKTDAAAAAAAYQRAAEINTRNGSVWARIAIVHTLSSPPDWVRALQTAAKAHSLGYDSANLRTAMAAAEFGRAEIFRRSSRPERAEDAELIARRHLERARELAPDDPEVVASVSRLMAKYLLEQKRYGEAAQALELLAVQYPNDLQTQLMYAKALEGGTGREQDLFAAWARVWQLGGESDIPLDTARYSRITDGFDQRLFALARNVFQMTSGVATGALPRETALLQAQRSRDEMKMTVGALQLMRPPAIRAISDAHISRMFATDLMQQAVESYILYLETGADLNRSRAVDFHRQAIENLNVARMGAQTTTGRATTGRF